MSYIANSIYYVIRFCYFFIIRYQRWSEGLVAGPPLATPMNAWCYWPCARTVHSPYYK